ncbi:hypothetical protein NLU13_7316 [Sarocladium strictum]|uniref:Uncharacterized protein n=1 Tax=Sarocladium strictum TaxID=5046 RepID=A0AA39GDS5_SARSR|nr:hypothetical protein NLU13_7316 [Sarocladium strictum]
MCICTGRSINLSTYCSIGRHALRSVLTCWNEKRLLRFDKRNPRIIIMRQLFPLSHHYEYSRHISSMPPVRLSMPAALSRITSSLSLSLFFCVYCCPPPSKEMQQGHGPHNQHYIKATAIRIPKGRQYILAKAPRGRTNHHQVRSDSEEEGEDDEVFPHFCMACEREFSPQHHVDLYCSEACRKVDGVNVSQRANSL